MHDILSKFLVYNSIARGTLLERFAQTFLHWEEGSLTKEELVAQIYKDVNHLLVFGVEYGFDENLWHCYLTYLLMTDENPYSLTCERMGDQDSTINILIKRECQAFYDLYHFDFTAIERSLNIDCFSIITDYQAMERRERRYNKEVSDKLRAVSRNLGKAKDANGIFDLVTSHYREYGVGLLGMNRAFRVVEQPDGSIAFRAIYNTEKTHLSDLVGYDLQKKQLRYNTDAFVEGRSANNVLLYGDSGTGKSTSVKALIHEYYDRGLRMIEVYKHQFQVLPQVITAIKNRNYYFVIFIDDLSFEESEVEYKFLKAVIEGGVETKPDNILLYATSNRRHIVKELWSDRKDMEHNGEIHRSDTVEEKISLSSRFGAQINYSSPNRNLFRVIVTELAKRKNLDISPEVLLEEANKWELRHGGVSGRTAQQFINYLAGKK